MNVQRHEIEALFARLEGGRLDELSPEQVAALEAALNESPALAKRLSALRPPADGLLQTRAAGPTNAEWARTWDGIESSIASQRHGSAVPTGWIYTLGRAAAAIAACVGLVVLWRMLPTSTPPASAAGWELAMSDDTEILELEVFDGR